MRHAKAFVIRDELSGLFWTGRGGTNGWSQLNRARTYGAESAAKSVISNESSWVTKRFTNDQWVDTHPTITPANISL